MSLEELVNLPDDMKTKFVAALAARVFDQLDEETRAALFDEVVGELRQVRENTELLVGFISNWQELLIEWAKDDECKKSGSGLARAIRDYDLKMQLDNDIEGSQESDEDGDDDSDSGGGGPDDDEPPPDDDLGDGGVEEPVEETAETD